MGGGLHWRDGLWLVGGALRAQRLRAGLTVLGIAVGIAAVVLLTALGEGLQRYVLGQFTQFGTNLISVAPGKRSTFGVSTGMFGTTRPLSLEDAEALRRVPQVLALSPVIQGNARVEAGPRSRRTEVLGVGPQATMVWQFRVAAGHFLPADNLSNPRPLAVLGAGLKRELFGSGNPLGASVRIGQDRFRVVGVMEAKGQVLGFDIDNTLYIPAARALALFNREGLMEINLLYRPEAEVQTVESALQRLLAERHGREDFTVISQTQMLQSLAGILAVLTAAVAALGGISLLVGAVGILTIMTIVVTERTPEIGLLRALGAPRRLILGLFLAEAVLLALVGGAAGLLGGGLLAGLLALSVPGLPLHVSLFYALLALLLSFAIGLLAGVLPARQAARLDPVQALRTQ